MIQPLKDGLVAVWSRAEIEEALGLTLSDAQFQSFVNELNDPEGVFEDMALSMFDVILEEILATDACKTAQENYVCQEVS